MKLQDKDGGTAARSAPSRPVRDKEVTTAWPGRTFFSAITCTAQSSLRHAAIFSKGSLARTKAVPGRQEETGSGVGVRRGGRWMSRKHEARLPDKDPLQPLCWRHTGRAPGRRLRLGVASLQLEPSS